MPLNTETFHADFFNEHSQHGEHENVDKSGLGRLPMKGRARSRSGTLISRSGTQTRKYVAGMSEEGLNDLEKIAEPVHYPLGTILV
jgi:hypothetical protein